MQQWLSAASDLFSIAMKTLSYPTQSDVYLNSSCDFTMLLHPWKSDSLTEMSSGTYIEQGSAAMSGVGFSSFGVQLVFGPRQLHEFALK